MQEKLIKICWLFASKHVKREREFFFACASHQLKIERSKNLSGFDGLMTIWDAERTIARLAPSISASRFRHNVFRSLLEPQSFQTDEDAMSFLDGGTPLADLLKSYGSGKIGQGTP